MTDQSFTPGDRVTVVGGVWVDVLGTVVRANDVGDVFVELKALGSIDRRWMPASHLRRWAEQA